MDKQDVIEEPEEKERVIDIETISSDTNGENEKKRKHQEKKERKKAILMKGLAQIGFTSFKSKLQRKVVEFVLSGRDSLVLMPTGAGKSVCFIVPALILNGLALVVTPLISLMKDQVDKLKAKGVKAEYLSSTLTETQRKQILANVTAGSIKLLYVTPECLTNYPSWLCSLHKQNLISLIAIDEAHCVSEYGHSFRPRYRALGGLRKRLKGVRIIALTATATSKVQADILELFNIDRGNVFLQSCDRPNIYYQVEYKDCMSDPIAHLKSLLCSVRMKMKGPGIIYTHKREDAEKLAKVLSKDKILQAKICCYHAGMSKRDRLKSQEEFLSGVADICCATVAFGMGIDKSNIRYVVHWTLPKTLEGYYQESGRGGRDGNFAKAILYYSKEDRRLFEFLARKEDERRRQMMLTKNNDSAQKLLYQNQEKAVKRVVNYCERKVCRRKTLMKHFGESYQKDVVSTKYKCCDVCRYPSRVADAVSKLSSVSRIAGASKIRSISGKKASFPELEDPFKLSESDYKAKDPRMNRKEDESTSSFLDRLEALEKEDERHKRKQKRSIRDRYKPY